MPETQASGESPGSGNSTSSGAGADETMPTDKGVAAGVPVSSGKTRRVSSYFVYKPRLRPFDVCPQTESSCSANMACTTACIQLVSSVIQ
jgi:hypothetical protein